MKPEDALLALVTAPDMETARLLARESLEKRLAACANLIPGLESHYWWEGKLENTKEVLVILKTTREQAPALEQLVLKVHPYETPEFVLIAPTGANSKYLEWWQGAISPGKRPIA